MRSSSNQFDRSARSTVNGADSHPRRGELRARLRDRSLGCSVGLVSSNFQSFFIFTTRSCRVVDWIEDSSHLTGSELASKQQSPAEPGVSAHRSAALGRSPRRAATSESLASLSQPRLNWHTEYYLSRGLRAVRRAYHRRARARDRDRS